jgi:predicted dehydrogenase
MKKMIKAAIIGCGDIAGGYDERKTVKGVFSHAGSYSFFPNVDIASAFDIDHRGARHFCRYWNIRDNPDTLDELLSKKYDIISVCTPDHTHYDIVMKILRSGSSRYIWAEKPFATTGKNAMALIGLAKKKKVGLWLTNQRRWDPAHKALKRAITKGVIGDVLHATGYYVKGITHIGCTMIDTLRFLIGEIAWARAFPPFDNGSYGRDRSLRGILGFDNGATASIIGCDKKKYVYSIFEIDIIGTRGRVRIDANGDRIIIYNAVNYGHYSGFRELKVKKTIRTNMQITMKYGLSYILKDLERRRYSVDSAIEGAEDLKVVDALRLSAQKLGAKIEI